MKHLTRKLRVWLALAGLGAAGWNALAGGAQPLPEAVEEEIKQLIVMIECELGDAPTNGAVRRVRISRPFQLGRYEVTQEQWEAVMGANPSLNKGARHPVDYVSWDDVQEFLGEMNQRNDGFVYRQPTEAEWEYAARAGWQDEASRKAFRPLAGGGAGARRFERPCRRNPVRARSGRGRDQAPDGDDRR
ncbi:MAG: SUMF1/EgtB/PvdO family nonheme iron enzyme [Acidobacteriota bacterium]